MKNYKLLFITFALILGLVNDFKAQSLGINNPTPDPSSIVDMVATDRGLLIPRMTTAQRNAIVSPANGLMIINTTTACNEMYWGGVWNSMGCACVGAPAAPVATAGTGLLATQFTANWIAAAGSTAYYLDVSTDPLFGSFVGGFNNLNVSNVTGYNVTGLTCNTTYYFRVRAVNNCGTGVSSNVITVLTSAAAGPTAIAATNVQQDQLDANWGAIGGATAYFLDVAIDPAFVSYVPGYINLNVGLVTTTNVTGLTCGTTYYYRVRAGTACGASANSNTISQATISSPAAPVAALGSALLQTQFTANWVAVPGATTYYLDVATDAAFTSFVPGYSGISTGVVTSYNVSGLACNTLYYYRLRSTSGCGTSANSNTITVTSCACSPTSAAASNVLSGSFSANWAAAGGATTYYIDVATDAAFTAILPAYTNLNTGLVTTYSITGLTCNTAYYYRVRTGSTCAVSGNSATVTLTTTNASATTASAASAIAQTQLNANWVSASGATSYELDVATDAGFTSFVINNLNVGLVTNYTVGGLICNTTYYYRIRVVYSCGTSANSNAITTSTCVCTPTANAASSIVANGFAANWSAVPAATTYFLDVATDIAFTSMVTGFNNLNVGNVVTYSVTGLACNTAYYYRLRASSSCGTSVSSNIINPTTLLTSAPTATAASAAAKTSFTANWTAFSGATSYRLDVATDAGFTSMVAGFNDLNVALVTTYSVTGLTCNTTYYYRIRVVNACGTSVSSNTITTTTLFACTWMTSNWDYKAPITITNGGGALTNYPVRVTLNTSALVSAAKMQASGADIRVVAADKCTQLDFWIETGSMNTTTTRIWVEIPSLAAGATTIYIYYGNATATTASNGANVFTFFDDFPGAAVDATKWTVFEDGSASENWTVSGGELRLLVNPSEDINNTLTSIATFSGSTGAVLETKSRTVTQATNGHMVAGFWSSTSNGFGYLHHTGTDYHRNDATWTAIAATAPTATNLRTTITAKSATLVDLAVINYNTGASYQSYTNLSNAVVTEPIRIGDRADNGVHANTLDTYWDWILVRSYAATEPTTANGTEEAACL